MSYSLDDLAAAVVTNLQPLASGNGGPFGQILTVAANPTPPCAFVTDGPIVYDEALGRGSDLITFKLVVQTGLTTERGAQEALRSIRSSSMVKAAVESDQRLGGLCDYCRVVDCGEPELFGRGDGTQALGCVYTVQILASGS